MHKFKHFSVVWCKYSEICRYSLYCDINTQGFVEHSKSRKQFCNNYYNFCLPVESNEKYTPVYVMTES